MNVSNDIARVATKMSRETTLTIYPMFGAEFTTKDGGGSLFLVVVTLSWPNYVISIHCNARKVMGKLH